MGCECGRWRETGGAGGILSQGADALLLAIWYPIIPKAQDPSFSSIRRYVCAIQHSELSFAMPSSTIQKMNAPPPRRSQGATCIETIKLASAPSEITYAHKLLHLLPLHAALELALLRSCQSDDWLAVGSKFSPNTVTHPSILAVVDIRGN